MTRGYDALNLTDGHKESVEYTYIAEDEENVVIFSDRRGVKRKGGNITQYSSILGEVIEDDLWNQSDEI